jgi:SAM-dependent methyltransferase
MNATLENLRPEIAAGGFARDSGAIGFYVRVNALLSPDMVVIDLGAGRGEMFDTWPAYGARLARLQGKVRRVIGLDVDAAIAQHPYLDERHVIALDGAWPVDDQSVDLIVADWVLEHVANPALLAREIERVLKPGGWFCARTPNRWGYVGMGARLVPNSLHGAMLRTFWPDRQGRDVFPTVYRLNSLRDVSKYFPEPLWKNASYVHRATPKYFGGSRFVFKLIGAFQALAPNPIQTDLLLFVQRTAEASLIAAATESADTEAH